MFVVARGARPRSGVSPVPRLPCRATTPVAKRASASFRTPPPNALSRRSRRTSPHRPDYARQRLWKAGNANGTRFPPSLGIRHWSLVIPATAGLPAAFHSPRGRGPWHAARRMPGWRNGRRWGLKIPYPKGCVGSIPTPGTNYKRKIDKNPLASHLRIAGTPPTAGTLPRSCGPGPPPLSPQESGGFCLYRQRPHRVTT